MAKSRDGMQRTSEAKTFWKCDNHASSSESILSIGQSWFLTVLSIQLARAPLFGYGPWCSKIGDDGCFAVMIFSTPQKAVSSRWQLESDSTFYFICFWFCSSNGGELFSAIAANWKIYHEFHFLQQATLFFASCFLIWMLRARAFLSCWWIIAPIFPAPN